MSVIIETTLGDIVVDLYVEERPRCCLNFIKLCKIKYYNFCLFHSVQRNFVAQTGDPTGTGRSGESIFRMIYGDQAKFFDAERQPKLKHVKAGTISMVNDGNGFHGSQFLITLGENLDSLDGVQTVFGEVAEGMDVLLKINEAFCDGENRPYQDIRITHTVIIDDPLDDPPGLVIPDRSPDPTPEQIGGCFRIAADEEINPDEGADPDQIKKKEEKKEAAHRAQVLEIIGDIPDKDVKPPDNVLFVCKLNALTTDEDLEIIFSRFGTIVSCEIIRDYKTGDSLQYAFIEFESADMCEKAYYKMDNVLIDDRRIHVDFSQSVSKTKYPKIWRPENDKKKKADEKDTSKHPRLHQSHRNSSSPAHRDKSSRDREKAERTSRDDVEKMRRDSAPRRKKSSSSRHVDSVSEHSLSQKRIKKESHDNRKIQQMKNRHSVESSHSLSESGNHHAGNHHKASTRYKSDSSVEPCEVRGGKHGKKCDVRDHDGVIRSRDVIHREERHSRRRVTSPPRRRHRHDVSDDTDSSSESGHVERKHRNDVVTSHSRKRDVGDRENGIAKKKKRKHKREKLSDNTKNKSRRADWTDMTSSDEAEVRCGKHRKRSVSSKRDVRRK